MLVIKKMMRQLICWVDILVLILITASVALGEELDQKSWFSTDSVPTSKYKNEGDEYPWEYGALRESRTAYLLLLKKLLLLLKVSNQIAFWNSDDEYVCQGCMDITFSAPTFGGNLDKITHSEHNVTFHNMGGGEKKDTKRNDDKENESNETEKTTASDDRSSATSTTCTKASGCAFDHTNTLGELYQLFLRRRQYYNMRGIINSYLKQSKENISNNEKLKEYFDIEHFDYPTLTKKGVLRLLANKFPEAYGAGKLVHISLNYADSDASISDSILKEYASSFYGINLQDETPKSEYIKELMKRSEQQSGMYRMHLCLSKSFTPLVHYFIEQLQTMPTESWITYVIQSEELHSTIVFVRRRDFGSYRILLLDSRQALRFKGGDKQFSPESELAIISLITAMDYTGAMDGKFYFLPWRRQVDLYTCPAFILNDLDTLFEAPMLPDYGYQAVQAKDVQLSLWNPVLDKCISESSNLDVNGEPWEPRSRLEDSEVRSLFGDMVANHLRRVERCKFFDSGKYTFHSLKKFPSAFLFLTQGKENTDKLIEKFSEKDKEKVKAEVEKETSLCSNRHDEVSRKNLAAFRRYMELVNELVFEIDEQAASK